MLRKPLLHYFNCFHLLNTSKTFSTTSNMVAPVLKVKKLSEHAVTPSHGSALAAGYDLSSAYDAVIPAKGKGVVKTDLAIATPEGTYARVAPRSGLAVKHFIDVGAGVVDQDYRGQLGVVLFNHSDNDFIVKRGDRIAQLVLEKIEYAALEVVEELDETDRGAGGFGSTGVSETLPIKKRKAIDVEPSPVKKRKVLGDIDVNTTKITPDSSKIILQTISELQSSGEMKDETADKLRRKLFSATEQSLVILSTALTTDAKRSSEWIDAFLDVTK